MVTNPTLFVLSYQRFVDRLQEAGHEVRQSVLKNGVWTVTVNPRPFLVIRTRYSDAAGELAVSVRRPFFYTERLCLAVHADSIDAAVARAIAVHDEVAGVRRRG